jgi:chromosome segregation ATPase
MGITEAPTRTLEDVIKAETALKVKLAEANAVLNSISVDRNRAAERIQDLEGQCQILRKDLDAAHATVAARENGINLAKSNAAEHLLRRRKAEEVVEPLRRELRMAHDSVKQLREVEEKLRADVTTERHARLDIQRRLEASLETCAMMQGSRDRAQRECHEAKVVAAKERECTDGLDRQVKALRGKIEELEAQLRDAQKLAAGALKKGVDALGKVVAKA